MYPHPRSIPYGESVQGPAEWATDRAGYCGEVERLDTVAQTVKREATKGRESIAMVSWEGRKRRARWAD